MTTKPAAQQLSRMSAGELLSGQPPEWSVPHAVATIRDRVKGQGTHIAVLDDDPTGTQSLHGVPVLTTWESADLRAALRHPPNAFFVLTNSRGRSRPEAAAISQTIATRLADLADELGIDVEAISRSDSTLRGHFPTEIDALQQGFGERGRRYGGVIICPCFLEAGRVTVNDVQWVREGDQFVPAAGTEFAADATFGYQSSNLRAWVQEKTEGRIPFEEVRSISLANIRNGGPRRVAQLLQEPDGRAVIVNAASYADLEVFVLGLLEAEGAGRRFLYRTGPSFVRVRAGIEPSRRSPSGCRTPTWCCTPAGTWSAPTIPTRASRRAHAVPRVPAGQERPRDLRQGHGTGHRGGHGTKIPGAAGGNREPTLPHRRRSGLLRR